MPVVGDEIFNPDILGIISAQKAAPSIHDPFSF